jgi:hypothetical protein
VFHFSITVQSQGVTPPQQSSTGDIAIVIVSPRLDVTATPTQFLSSTPGQSLNSTITAVSTFHFTGAVSLGLGWNFGQGALVVRLPSVLMRPAV